MLAIFFVLAVIAAGGIWATETVDRPLRRKARLDQLGTAPR